MPGGCAARCQLSWGAGRRGGGQASLAPRCGGTFVSLVARDPAPADQPAAWRRRATTAAASGPTLEYRRREGPLRREAHGIQPAHGHAYSPALRWPASDVERAETRQVVQARTIAGGQSDGVHRLPMVIGPRDACARAAGGEGPPIGATGHQRAAICAGIAHHVRLAQGQPGADGEALDLKEPRPIIDVAIERVPGYEAYRRAGCQGRVRHEHPLCRDLYRRVADPDRDKPLAPE